MCVCVRALVRLTGKGETREIDQSGLVRLRDRSIKECVNERELLLGSDKSKILIKYLILLASNYIHIYTYIHERERGGGDREKLREGGKWE